MSTFFILTPLALQDSLELIFGLEHGTIAACPVADADEVEVRFLVLQPLVADRVLARELSS